VGLVADRDRERWNERYREASPQVAPSALLLESDAHLPRSGRGLDLAGGTGRHALWMARRGLAVTLAEVSDVAAARADSLAAQEGLRLAHALLDLEEEPFPAGPWDLVVCAYFLYRPIFQAAARALAPGGVLAVVHPTLRNLERNPKPGAAYLLAEGELPGLAAGLEVVRFDEAWRENGQHEAWLLARREYY
jgi:SAM-dependent methyltransferase